MTKTTIVLEGLPASGKTTLANFLRDNFNCFKVNESLGKLADIDLTMDQAEVFSETCNKYEIANSRSENVCLIDRGYPSMLAWDYCAERLEYARDLVEKKEWVKDALSRKQLFEPYLYIYLDIDPASSLLRRPRNEIKEDVWSGEAGMKHCRVFYDNFFNQRKNSFRIDAKKSTIVIAQLILEKIHERV